MHLKIGIRCCLVGSDNVNQVKLVDIVLQIFCSHNNFSLLILSTVKRVILTSFILTADLSICPWSSINFFSVFWSSAIRSINVFLMNWVLYYYEITLSLLIFFTVKLTPSDINVGVLAVFWLVLAWYIFFYPFTFKHITNCMLPFLCFQHLRYCCNTFY